MVVKCSIARPLQMKPCESIRSVTCVCTAMTPVTRLAKITKALALTGVKTCECACSCAQKSNAPSRYTLTFLKKRLGAVNHDYGKIPWQLTHRETVLEASRRLHMTEAYPSAVSQDACMPASGMLDDNLVCPEALMRRCAGKPAKPASPHVRAGVREWKCINQYVRCEVCTTDPEASLEIPKSWIGDGC